MKRRCLFLLTTVMILVSLGAVAQTGWTSNNGPYFAVIDDYAVGLKNGQVVLYAADSSETSLMKSTDRGETWFHVLSITGSAVQSVATAKNNADIVYAGVRTGDLSNKGIWKSTDGGQSWTHLASQPSNPVVNRIAIDPTNSNNVWVGCWRVPGSDLPVVHKSTNGGQSWTAYSIAAPPNTNRFSVSDIAIADANYIWVSTYNNGSLGNEGIWQTRDGGLSWDQKNSNIDINNINMGALAVDPNHTDTLYIGNLRVGSGPVKLYKTVNGRDACTWSQVNVLGSGLHYYSDIRVSPQSSNVVYVATGASGDGIGVLKSTNGGTSWTALTSGISEKKLHAVEVDPLDGTIVWTGGEGAHYKSVNSGATWYEKNFGMLFPTTNALAKSGSTIQSIGRGFFFRSNDVGNTWKVVFDETWMSENPKDVAIDPNDVNSTLAGFGIPQESDVYKTTDKGDTWQLVLGIGFQDPGPSAISGIAYKSVGSQVVHACGFGPYTGFIFKSVNSGSTWQQSLLVTGLRLNTVAASGSIAYAGGNNSSGATVYATTDDGSTWSQVSSGLPGTGATVRSVSIYPGAPKTAYAGTSAGVYKTIGGGDTWTSVSNGITYTDISSVVIHPTNMSVVYAASNDGSSHGHVYRTTDDGSSWSEISTGLPQCKITDLTIDPTDPNEVFAATDAGVYHIIHSWIGEIGANTTWAGNVLVGGDLTVPTGITLTVSAGTSVQVTDGFGITVHGQMQSAGDDINIITFTPSSTAWKGISCDGSSGSTFTYNSISGATIALKVLENNSTVISNCTIDGGSIGIDLYHVELQGERVPTEVSSNTITNQSSAGMLVDEGASNVWIHNNYVMYNDLGISFNDASPLAVEGNIFSDSNTEGIQCVSSSPSLIDGTSGAHNCSVFNQYGVVASHAAYPVLGLSQSPGYNTIAYNTSYQIRLQDHCNVSARFDFFRNNGPNPSVDFSLDTTCTLDYASYLTRDPNACAVPQSEIMANQQNISTPGIYDNPLVMQSLQLRLQGQHLNAIAVLKNLISNNPNNQDILGWALRELVANYQRLNRPTGSNVLSTYLRTMLESQAYTHSRGHIRRALSAALVHEADVTGGLSVLDEIIQSQPNTSHELLALYGKVSLGLNVLQDRNMALNALQSLNSRYPAESLTLLAGVLISLSDTTQGNRPAGGFGKAGIADPEIPTSYSLAQNYPNPFNPTTQIRFALAKDGNVALKLYDILGREVRTLVEGYYVAGSYTVSLDASQLATGVYFYRLNAQQFSAVKKLMVVK